MTKNDAVEFVGENRKKIIFAASVLAGAALLVGGVKTMKPMKALKKNVHIGFKRLDLLATTCTLEDLGDVGKAIVQSYKDVTPMTKVEIELVRID